jgi:hypothetical protein
VRGRIPWADNEGIARPDHLLGQTQDWEAMLDEKLEVRLSHPGLYHSISVVDHFPSFHYQHQRAR